jgi:hypothetical protein
MYYHPTSRRWFLRGLGAGLMLPLLPSLASRARAAEAPPVRYIQLVSPYGCPGASFFPSDTGLVQGASGVFARPLSGITGPISPLFDASFDNYKSKISLVRGLHVLPKGGVGENHNASYPTCSSMVNNNGDPNTNDNYPGFYPFTLDAVLAQSDKTYPSAAGVQRHVNITPAYQLGSRSNFSWARINGKIQHVPNTTTTSALQAKFPQLSSSALPPTPDADERTRQRKRDLLHAVYEDYRSTRNHPRLSSDDRLRLDSYIGLIDSLQKGLEAEAGGTTGAVCKNPALDGDVDLDARTRNQLRIVAAAMACQLTRVASVTMIRPGDDNGAGHTIHHDASDEKVAAYEAPNARHVSFLLGLLDQLGEGNGTLLDNSVVFYTMEFGERYPGNVQGHIHTHKDMTVMVAGGGAGALTMGQYIDYRKTKSRPYNNMLISLYNAMGLSSSDYEREGAVGIGDYEPSLVEAFGFQAYSATPERRKPLPLLYKGAALG